MEKLFESITFDGFCSLLKRYKRTYENIARSINCVERTLRRYRKGVESYSGLSEDKYDRLFKCLEKECKSSGENIIQVIVDFFGLPIDYLDKEYSELKNIAINFVNILNGIFIYSIIFKDELSIYRVRPELTLKPEVKNGSPEM